MPADSILRDSLFDSSVVTSVAQDDLVRLSTYTLACVHHKGFLSPELLSTLSPLVDNMPLTSVNPERVYPPVLRYGPTLNDFARDGQLDPGYWAASARARVEWANARLPCDPFEICLDWVDGVWGSRPEPARIGGSPLLAGTVRKSAGGLRVHFDEVAREFPGGLFDQKVVVQLALNVYLAVPPIGGETTIWRHTWEPIDEPARIGYGYEESVVEGVQSITVRPEAGDVLIFSPRFYHKVAPSGDSPRVSVAMFLGITVDGAIVVWS